MYRCAYTWLISFSLITLSFTACRTSDKRSNSPAKNPPSATTNPSPSTDPNVITETNQDFTNGNTQAPVKLEYFADLQCGACKNMSIVLDDVMKKYPNKVLWIFRNFPKDSSCWDYQGTYNHQYACKAHVAARCVGLTKNRFWDMKDRIFANQEATTPAALKDWARGLGMTEQQYDACIAMPAVLDKVKADIADGKSRGVTGTPTIYINGVKIYPATRAKVEAEINRQLR